MRASLPPAVILGIDTAIGLAIATQFVETWAWVVLASGIAFILPNTQQIIALFRPALDRRRVDANAGRAVSGWLIWIPSRRWAVLLSLLATASLLSLNRPSEFLHFQF
jgi:alginate O-acetyltransferase complex protein AlgI